LILDLLHFAGFNAQIPQMALPVQPLSRKGPFAADRSGSNCWRFYRLTLQNDLLGACGSHRSGTAGAFGDPVVAQKIWCGG